MTLEELKAEAAKHGYKLTKEYKYEKLTPCTCGNKRIVAKMFYDRVNGKIKTSYCHKCSKCGFVSEGAKTKYEAKAKWNECVARIKALEYITADIDTLIDTREGD